LYDVPHVPVYPEKPDAVHDAAQSTTWLAPVSVHRVSVPSPLHVARAPAHAGKQPRMTADDGDVSSPQEAFSSASAHPLETRSATYSRLQSPGVPAIPHSETSFAQSASTSIVARPLEVPDVPDVPDVPPELPFVPGYGSQAARKTRRKGRARRTASS